MPNGDAVTMIDVVYHIPPEARAASLKNAERLRPGGFLIIKDIDKTPRAKYLWNYVHDLLMTRFQRCAYRPKRDMRAAEPGVLYGCCRTDQDALAVFSRSLSLQEN